ncbi:hypothetical protein YN1_0090 [Nanoarchaeota archaeon]
MNLFGKDKKYLIEILIILFIFLFTFSTKGLLMNALGNYDLVGPDAYLFFTYFESLVYNHIVPYVTYHLDYPLPFIFDNKDLVSYFAYLSYLIITFMIDHFSSGFFGFLSLLGIHPAATIITWLSADFTNALTPAIAGIVFYFLAKDIFKDKYLALFSAIIFAINPFLTSRLVLFDTELGAVIFVVLSFYLIIKYIDAKPENNNYKRLSLILYSLIALIIFYKTFLLPNYDTYLTIELFIFFFLLLFLYPVFKGTREYYLTLLVFTTTLARKGWGGWIIIPMIFGLFLLIRFFYNRDYKEAYFYLPYMGFTGILENDLSYHLFLADHNILFELSLGILYLYDLIKNTKIFEKLNSLSIGKIIKDNELSKKILLFLIIVLIGSPIIIEKVISNFLINPFTASRMGSTIAEFQPTPASYYFSLFGSVGVLFTYLGLSYLIFNKDKPKKYLFSQYIFIFLLSGSEIVFGSSIALIIIYLLIYSIAIFSISKGEKKYAIQSVFEVLTLSVAMYFIVFSDIVINGNYISIAASWMIFFILILPYIILINRNMNDKEIFSLSLSFLTIIVGKYIFELVYYAGFALPLLYSYGIQTLEIFKDYYEKIKNTVKEYLNLILLVISSISSISLILYTTSLYKSFGLSTPGLVLIFFALPLFFLIYYIINEYILEKETNNLNILKYGIILLSLFGVFTIYNTNIYGAPGYILNYFIPLYTQGTPNYEIQAFTWINQNTPPNAIINSWWDYGYYIYSIGNRTAWINGANSYPYWNHLMGRYGLSADNITKTLQLFYVHADYNYQTFKTLELFNENSVFYDYLYKNLGFTKEQVEEIEKLKEQLGYNNWIKLLYSFNGSPESIEEFNLSQQDIQLLEKLYNMNYLKPAYLYIDPTDVGKSFAFQFLGSNESFNKESWVSQFYSGSTQSPGIQIPTVYYNGYYIFAQNNTLFYFGEEPLDQNLNINGTEIERCIYVQDLGIINQNSCGLIIGASLVFNQSIVSQSGIYETLNVNNINPNNLVRAYVYILDPLTNQEYALTLKYVDLDGELVTFNNATYGGLLYVTPVVSLLQQNNPVGEFLYAYFISQKATKYDWVQLYFLDNSYNGTFQLVYYTNEQYGLPPIIYEDIAPAKVWKINFPENFTVPDYLYCLYLATNLQQINECAEIYHFKPYTNYYNV